MENQAVPAREDNAEVLYFAFELSRKNWKLGFSDGRVPQIRQVTIRSGDLEACREQIEKAKQRLGMKKPVQGSELLRSGARRFLATSGAERDGNRKYRRGRGID